MAILGGAVEIIHEYCGAAIRARLPESLAGWAIDAIEEVASREENPRFDISAVGHGDFGIAARAGEVASPVLVRRLLGQYWKHDRRAAGRDLCPSDGENKGAQLRF